MRSDRAEPFAISGVPLVFDRFSLMSPRVPDVIDPLTTAHGITTGLALGLALWSVIAAFAF